ncbi:MAG: hypothetical protein ACREIP_17945, partial [Alphaproteobacteria bacterium]
SDGVVGPDVLAIFFSDAGIGLDDAGIARLADLDTRKIIAATASAQSARIGDARNIYADGILSHVNKAAAGIGISPGIELSEAVALILDRYKAPQAS